MNKYHVILIVVVIINMVLNISGDNAIKKNKEQGFMTDSVISAVFYAAIQIGLIYLSSKQ